MFYCELCGAHWNKNKKKCEKGTTRKLLSYTNNTIEWLIYISLSLSHPPKCSIIAAVQINTEHILWNPKSQRYKKHFCVKMSYEKHCAQSAPTFICFMVHSLKNVSLLLVNIVHDVQYSTQKMPQNWTLTMRTLNRSQSHTIQTILQTAQMYTHTHNDEQKKQIQ